MPVIDHVENPDDPDAAERQAERLEQYWLGKIRALGAQEIAGVGKMSKGKGKWDIVLDVQVPKDSQAYKDFMRRFSREL